MLYASVIGPVIGPDSEADVSKHFHHSPARNALCKHDMMATNAGVRRAGQHAAKDVHELVSEVAHRSGQTGLF